MTGPLFTARGQVTEDTHAEVGDFRSGNASLSKAIPRSVCDFASETLVRHTTAVDPLIGGLFAEHTSPKTSWRWVFYINFPFCLVIAVMLTFAVNLHHGGARARSIDWVGGVMFISSILSFLIAVSWGGIQFPWSSYHTLVPLCLGVVGLIATGFWERYGAHDPFVSLTVLTDRSSLAIYGATIIQGILLFGELYYISMYLEAVQDLSVVLTGVGLLPVSVMLMPSSVIVAFTMAKIGKYRWALWLGWIVTLVSTGALCILDQHSATATWVCILAVLGLGHGILFNALLLSAQAVSPAKDVAYAASMYTFMRTLGFSIGVIIGGTALQNTMVTSLKDSGLSTEIAHNAEIYVVILKSLPASSTFRQGVINAYVDGFRGVFETLTGIGGIGILVTPFIAHRSMDQVLESVHVLRRET